MDNYDEVIQEVIAEYPICQTIGSDGEYIQEFPYSSLPNLRHFGIIWISNQKLQGVESLFFILSHSQALSRKKEVILMMMYKYLALESVSGNSHSSTF